MKADLELQVRESEVMAAYFWSLKCQKCRIFGPSIESTSKDKGIPLVKIDVGMEKETAVHYDVLSLPTLIFFRKGREALRLTAGSMTREEIKSAFDKLCNSALGAPRRGSD